MHTAVDALAGDLESRGGIEHADLRIPVSRL